MVRTRVDLFPGLLCSTGLLCPSFCQYHTKNSAVGSIGSPASVSFFQRHLTFLEPLYFRMNLRVPLSISAVRTAAFGIGVALKLEISLSRNHIVTLLNLWTSKNAIVVHLFNSSFIPVSNILPFSMNRAFPSFIRFIPKAFILFDAIVHIFRSSSRLFVTSIYPFHL